MTNHLTAVSLFSGCGGFDWGAFQAGVRIIWANDISDTAVRAYSSIFPGVTTVQGDVSDIERFPDADVLIGCYPCTGFSVGARRRWRDRGDRNLKGNEGNFLYREFLRALRQVRPKYLFVENVRGMRSAEEGWFLSRQIHSFRQAGYRVHSKLLNSADFGVAQSRQRLFLVGVRSDVKRFKYEFPSPTHGGEGKPSHRVLQDVISDMPKWPEGEFYDGTFHGHYLTRQRKRGWNELSFTIVANMHHVPLHPMGVKMEYVAKDEWKLAGTENRRLSWKECRRIQGLPDHLEPSGSLANKYTVIGNAVPPAFGEHLLRPIVEYEHSR